MPHAPLALTRDYMDLPVDLAGVRGERELDVYGQLTATTSIQVVGNPMAVASDLLSPRTDTLVVAVSPVGPSQLRHLFETARADCAHRVVVAPHPRSDLTGLKRLIPSGWEINGAGSTYDLLKQGASLLVQATSGVGWEALYLGIPVVDVRRADVSAYAYLNDTMIPASRGPEDFASVAALARQHEPALLRQTALDWASPLGRAADVATLDLVARSMDEPKPPSPILDGWFER